MSAKTSATVLFAFLHSSTRREVQPKILVAGLDPARRYRMHAIDAAPTPADPVQSGAYWMSSGVNVPMLGDFQASGRVFDAVD